MTLALRWSTQVHTVVLLKSAVTLTHLKTETRDVQLYSHVKQSVGQCYISEDIIIGLNTDRSPYLPLKKLFTTRTAALTSRTRTLKVERKVVT
jgi:hypothetical protein